MSKSSRGQFLHVHLLVTGKTEEEHLTKLFSRLEATGVCRFAVDRRIQPLSPRSTRRQLRMVGTRGDRIPTRAENEISIPARLILREHPERILILVDDLEHDRSPQVGSVFQVYREALDKLLLEHEKSRAAVHFLVNMLEAYFFADPGACQKALGWELPTRAGDVEEIRNPKSILKQVFSSYHERQHGGQILEYLDLHNVLGDPETCAWLRSCVSWIVRALRRGLDASLHSVLDATVSACHLEDGRCEPLTLHQKVMSP